MFEMKIFQKLPLTAQINMEHGMRQNFPTKRLTLQSEKLRLSQFSHYPLVQVTSRRSSLSNEIVYFLIKTQIYLIESSVPH